MRRLCCWLLLLVSVGQAQDAAKFREYADAAAKVDRFSGVVL